MFRKNLKKGQTSQNHFNIDFLSRIDKLNENLNSELSFIKNELMKMNFNFLATQSIVMQRMFQIIKLLTIKKSLKLIRIGNNSDGGYYLYPTSHFNTLISCGIGDEITFENELLNRNLVRKIIAVDGSIENYPNESVNVDFLKKYLVSSIVHPEYEVSLEELTMKTMNTKNNLLKIDIEGSELEILSKSEVENYNNFDQIIIELHNLCKIILSKDSHDFDALIKSLEKLNSNFEPIFIHCNNSGQYINLTDFPFPQVLEVTYVKKELLMNSPKEISKDEFISYAYSNPNNNYIEDHQIIEKLVEF